MSLQRAGISNKAHSRQRRSENMIRKANVFRIVRAETKRTANPRITETALIVIPLPVVLSVL